jgi:xylulokinase
MAERLALVVDLGTGGPKAAVISPDGELVASAVGSVRTTRIGSKGAEQHPEELWDAVVLAVRDVIAQAGDRRENIAGLICISQYSSIVPVDASGAPAGNLILWMDGRGAPHGMALYGQHPMAVPTWIEHHGAIPLPSGADSLSHMLFIKNEQPAVYERTRYFLEAMDFLTLRFTGEATANLGTAFMMLLTDNRDPKNLDWDTELLAMAGIDRDKLPTLVPMRSRVGTVRRDVAQALGLPPDVSVYSAMNDTQAAAIGTGTFLAGRGGLNVGTTCQVLAHMARKDTDFDSHLVSMPSPIRGKYLVIAENGLGGAALRHLVEGVLFADGALGDAVRERPYENLDRALDATEPGAGGVLFLPWLAGALFPEDDPAMRGGFLNVSLDTTREHLVRAVVEGVALNLCAMIEPVERFAAETFRELAFSGGGALSSGWAQVLADVSQRPVHQLAHARFVNNLAGALMVFEQMGLSDLASVTELVRTERVLSPRPEHGETYRRLGEHLRKAFGSVQPVCQSLNA